MDDITVSEIPEQGRVSVRYWAGAKAAAGVETDDLVASTVGELRAAAVAAHPDLRAVMGRCSILVDGRRADDDHVLAGASCVEVLPPFAGG